MPADLCATWQSAMASHRYHYFDTTLSSTRGMAGLPEYRGQTEFKYHEVDYSLITGHEDWRQDWNRGSDKLLASCARVDDGYLFRHDTLGDYQIDLQKRTIVCRPGATADNESLQHLLLDQVIPRTLGQLGRTILHASAVRPDGGNGAIAFVGRSGAGKSTMAASFIKDSARVLADDCLMLDIKSKQVVGIPVYPGSHLWADSANNLFPLGADASLSEQHRRKRRYSDTACRPKPVPVVVTMLIALEAHDQENNKTIALELITGYTAIMALMSRIFFLDPGRLHNIATIFTKIAAMLNSGVSFYRLRYPHNYEYLPQVRQQLLQLYDSQDDQARFIAGAGQGY